jgi:hypothetical protein
MLVRTLTAPTSPSGWKTVEGGPPKPMACEPVSCPASATLMRRSPPAAACPSVVLPTTAVVTSRTRVTGASVCP